jgi:hypothetical protein
MTVKNALAKAGIVDAETRLLKIGADARTGSKGNYEKAVDLFYREVCADPELLWFLLKPYKFEAARPFLAAPAAPAPKPAAPPAAKPDDRAGLMAAARMSVLDTFTVNGQPIGDITAREAKDWARARRRDARFVELLTENLPPAGRIRDYRDAADADRTWKLASEDAA